MAEQEVEHARIEDGLNCQLFSKFVSVDPAVCILSRAEVKLNAS